MTRIRLITLEVLTAVALLVAPAGAQTGTLGGVVIDARTASPLVGATVVLDGSDRRALSNVDGRYRIADLPPGEYQVSVNYTGFATETSSVTVSEGNNTADFELEIDPIMMDEIVVTGQQIERQARELAYSVSTVRGEELVQARETNLVTALAGRAAGVDILTQSGNVGASSRIVIRGVSSLSGNNQPLFVVDGVPISNSNIVAGTSQSRLTGAIDVGNRASDLSADAIESVTVLKGGAAAALYGQRAKNGVILITTKRGASVQGQTITASSSLRVSSPLVLPDFQNEYAQGDAGAYSPTDLDGWGPRIAGQEAEDIRGETITLQPFPDNVRDIYEDALLSISNVSLSSGTENGDFRLGVTRQDEDGIVPNSNQVRTSINLNSGYTVTPTVSARLSGFYVKTESQGRAVAGANDPNVFTSSVNTLPRTFDSAVLRNFKDASGAQIPISNFDNNPFWIANENVFSQDIERISGNGSVDFTPFDWLNLTGRIGLDSYTENRRNVNAVGTIGRDDGLFSQDVIERRELTIDLLSEARTQLNEDFNLRGVVGFNANEIQQTIQRAGGVGLSVPGLYNFANANSTTSNNSFSERHLFGVFADATLGFRDYLFLNLTGRNDWSSTLPRSNRSFFYPSTNLSFVFTDAFNLPDRILTFGKLRLNFAQVGSDEDPYQLAFVFNPVDDIFGQYGTGNTFPYGGRVGFNADNTIPPQDLKPQNQTTFEVGGELQFFDGRLGVDFTYYDQQTDDQILSIPIPESTGFGSRRTNIGTVENKGVEVTLNLNPIRTRSFNWEALVNFDRNRNKVVSLAPDVDELIIQSAFNSLQVKAVPGQSFGIYGPGFLRDSVSGLPIIDPNTGLRQEGPIVRLGDIDPDFRMSLYNQFTYGRASLGFLVTWRQGGNIFSQTVGQLRRSGLAEETAVNREASFIDEGVIRNGDGTMRPNDVPVQNMQAFWQRYASAGIHEGNVFDATNVRLREVRLDFSVPRDWLGNTFIGGLTVGVEARNLFLLYKEVPHIDPETGLFGSASDGQGIEWNVLPTTRSFGVNLQVQF